MIKNKPLSQSFTKTSLPMIFCLLKYFQFLINKTEDLCNYKLKTKMTIVTRQQDI